MTVVVTRDLSRKMKNTVSIRAHEFAVDEGPDNGGEDLGPTPHDLYDYDAVETPVLIDEEFQGRPRKLLGQSSSPFEIDITLPSQRVRRFADLLS